MSSCHVLKVFWGFWEALLLKNFWGMRRPCVTSLHLRRPPRGFCQALPIWWKTRSVSQKPSVGLLWHVEAMATSSYFRRPPEVFWETLLFFCETRCLSEGLPMPPNTSWMQLEDTSSCIQEIQWRPSDMIETHLVKSAGPKPADKEDQLLIIFLKYKRKCYSTQK